MKVKEGYGSGEILLLKLQYTGDSYVCARVKVNFYNESGYLIKKTDDDVGYFEYGETNTLWIELPTNSKGEQLEYNFYTIEILECYRAENYVSAKDKLVIGAPGEMVLKDEPPNRYTYTSEIPMQNTGSATIQRVRGITYFWKDGDVIGAYTLNSSGIIGGEQTSGKATWYATERNNYVVPDRVTVECNYAYSLKEATEKKQIENKDIIYGSGIDESLQKFELVSDMKVKEGYGSGEILLLKLQYTGDSYVCARVKVNFYNESGYLIKKTDDDVGYFEYGETNTLWIELPTNSKREQLEYNLYTIEIWECYRVENYVSAKDKLVIGAPGEMVLKDETPNRYTYISEIPMQNTGNATIQRARGIIYFCKDGDVIGAYTLNSSGIIGGEQTSGKATWHATESNNYVVPDSVTVECNYAYISANE